MDLEAICAEALEERRVWTNEIFRKKRDINPDTSNPFVYLDSESAMNETEEPKKTDQLFTNSLSLGQSDGDRRQLIEIVFKLVGMLQFHHMFFYIPLHQESLRMILKCNNSNFSL